jgi:hypothetical protein
LRNALKFTVTFAEDVDQLMNKSIVVKLIVQTNNYSLWLEQIKKRSGIGNCRFKLLIQRNLIKVEIGRKVEKCVRDFSIVDEAKRVNLTGGIKIQAVEYLECKCF